MNTNEFDIVLSPQESAEISLRVNALMPIADVSTDAEARAADGVVKQAKTLIRVIHDQRMAVTRRIDAVKKQIMAKEKTLVAEMEEQVERVSALMNAYLQKKMAAEAERVRAAQEAAVAEAMVTGSEVAVPTADPVKASKVVDGVSARTVWTFRIVDPDLVPRAYCSPDESAIREYMNAVKRGGGDLSALNIPGVSFAAEIRT